MLELARDHPLAVAASAAIRGGEVAPLRRLLQENAGLANARIGPRSLLHIATDWPGHFPNNIEIVKELVANGADVNVAFAGPAHAETPLHWAASSDDVDVMDALIDAGADLESPGSVIGGGTALADAVAFGQWNAARRLVQCGARANLWQAAALGLMDRVEAYFAADPVPGALDVTNAFWCSCHGGQLEAAQFLVERGADVKWVGHDGLTGLGAARRSGADRVVAWLESLGG